MNSENIFIRLFKVIEDRKKRSLEKSYVAGLMHGGVEKINEKITEEAAEVCEAACSENQTHLTHEICDLLFHVFVLAGYKNIRLEEIQSELEKRFGTSGHEEKARRNR